MKNYDKGFQIRDQHQSSFKKEMLYNKVWKQIVKNGFVWCNSGPKLNLQFFDSYAQRYHTILCKYKSVYSKKPVVGESKDESSRTDDWVKMWNYVVEQMIH